LINGDDLAVAGPASLGPFLSQSVRDHGFEETVGKSFWSTSSVVINSQLFSIPENHNRIGQPNPKGKIERCGYVNQGIVFGEY
jgi:hypothetical protein